MRIAVLYQRLVGNGGVERYLSELLPRLIDGGHSVAFLYEDEPEAPPVWLKGVERWQVSRSRLSDALHRLKDFQPNVIFSHGVTCPEIEAAVTGLGPSVFLAHGYYGACISGTKRWAFPLRPCTSPFGLACILHFYPRRCGGLNPLTAAALYKLQSKRLTLLRHYGAVAVFSEYMRRTYRELGLADDKIHRLPSGISRWPVSHFTRQGPPWKLLFAGRMEEDKGGPILLRALPSVVRQLGVPIELTLVGDGRARAKWEELAESISQRLLSIRFTGWMEQPALRSLMAESDLLVVPSVWPEPWGLIGPEAQVQGLPAAAFAVGGIPEWLEEGRTGALAPSPPTEEGLAAAISRCLVSADIRSELARGAKLKAEEYSWDVHLEALLSVFRDVTVAWRDGSSVG